ncbi:hypothetical protein TSOC_002293 [Tetrabaena socialis]|uniref:Uncharacterized protein n=1 Tax=Tetrabaena socialis TaxID=47790 RepID=A0A2J8AEG2_9CHLO|nr:hypothetical protein TSOC_002293 [Tetrabaena socialis]|eukprot:PNH10903.1 hypothetical protein TSOC_002293 [Tetrabaena socialis]
MLGSGIPLHTMICSNWIPATIGNIIGGAFFVGTLYAGAYGTLYDRMWLRCLQAYVFVLPKSVRERIAAAHRSVHNTVYSWVDWDAITTPACELAARQEAAAAAAKSAPPAPSRSASSAIVMAASEAPRRLATAAAAALRNPKLTPFEQRRSDRGLGSDVV